MININDLQELIEQCLSELSIASNSDYEVSKAEKTAALFLTAQLKLSFLIEDIEFAAKKAKNDVSRVEAEKYSSLKEEKTDKKPSEAALAHSIAQDVNVQEAKTVLAKTEAATRKYNYLMATLKDGHLYFRNISKQKPGYGE